MGQKEEAPQPAAPAEESPKTTERRRRLPRWFVYSLAFVTAVAAALFVTFFSVDLGPYVKGQAEKFGSNYLARPMTIGKVRALVTPGTFEFDDVVIQGLTPQDRPFLRARRITVALPWWTIFNRKLLIESIQMTDWEMIIETYPGNRHNFPRVLGPPKPPNAPKKPKRFTTTLKQVLATGGRVTYIDHATPWSLETPPNMKVLLYRRDARDDYGGTATFDDATIRIQTYEPFKAKVDSRFSMKPPNLHFDRIDLLTDGATSILDGDIQLNNWPEQIYRIRSKIDIATQKGIFFKRDRFEASGNAEFEGTFHLPKAGGRELKGAWRTPVAHVKLGESNWRFPDLHGNVLWLPDRLEVTDAKSGLYGGTAQFDYRLLSLDQKSGPRRAVWDVKYRDVNLVELTNFLELEGIRLSGRATGSNRLEWPLGGWDLLRGSGELTVQPPAGMEMMGRELRPEMVAANAVLPDRAGPFNPRAPLGYVPIAGRFEYKLDPQWITLGNSWVATEKTFVAFDGRTAYMKRSNIPFHVTSVDWQEADRVFAGVLTSLGSPTSAVPVGGVGQFEGVMLGAFNDPRIEGTFTGDHMRAWDVVWGRGSAEVVIEDSYVNVSRSTLTKGDAEIEARGKFSLGYPRRDGGEEIDAHVTLRRWPMKDLRHAFEMDDWPVDGFVSGDYRLKDKYENPFGDGALIIDDGVAYGETFDRATASLNFEGTGVRAVKFDIGKSKGAVTGAAWIGWDGNYSFTADGERIPVESLKSVVFPKAPLSGVLRFKASGTGTFEVPSYDVSFGVVDLFAADEGIGQMSGHLGLRGDLMSLDFEAASPRLSVSGAGRVALTDEMDAELTLRFSQTSLDPYLRFFEPRLSPFTNAIAGGTVRVTGELTNLDHLLVEARVEDLALTLFDYQLRNEGVIELDLNNNVAEIGHLRLRGEGTQLDMTGTLNLHDKAIDVSATGDANLGILQGFYRDLRASGQASLAAGVTGTLDKPEFSGKATVSNGRVRQFLMPRSLEQINGTFSFDAGGIRVDSVTAMLGGGQVTFGGRIPLEGFVPGDLNLTAVGERMRLNYPEGFRSEIDADLTLRGTVQSPLLTGTVTVRDAVYARRFETTPNLLNLGRGSQMLGAPAASSAIPLRFDIQIVAPPGTLHVENNVANIDAEADLRLQGTYDRPQVSGRAEISGDLSFEGNRYRVTRGIIDFVNPASIDPYFDIEVETRIRYGDQTYRVTLSFLGTKDRFVPTITSDPPLPMADTVALLLGQDPSGNLNELRAFSSSAAMRSEEELLRGLTSRLLLSPFSAPVEQVAEQVLGKGTTVLVTPSIGREEDVLAAGLRVVIGRRLSNRAYITYSSGLGNSTRQQILVLEYDQNDRISWIFTQNVSGDQSYAVDFRVRHVF